MGGLPEQAVWDAIASTFGVGFTVTANVESGPGHPFALGVMVYVNVIGELVVFTQLWGGMVVVLVPFNVAVGVIPEGGVTVQLKVLPVTVAERFTSVVLAPEHIVCGGTELTRGVGFTVTANVTGVPGQLLATGVTV